MRLLLRILWEPVRRLNLAPAWPLSIAITTLFLIFSPQSKAQDKSLEDHELHAVFLLNVIHFVNWPDRAFDSDREPLQLCVLGDIRVANTLDELIPDEKIENRSIELRRISSIAFTTGCHLLFVSELSAMLSQGQYGQLAEQHMLLVSPAQRFAYTGGMLELRKQGEKIHLVLSLPPIKRAALTIKSRLLRLATVIDIEED